MTSQEVTKDLSRTLLEQTDAIAQALIKLERANLILGEWLTDYGFGESPDPYLCFNSNLPSNDARKAEANKWFYEYDKILGFIEIAGDYVHETKKVLEEAIRPGEDKAISEVA